MFVTTLVIAFAAMGAFGAVLLVVYRRRPQLFRVDVGLTRWTWFKIEMRWPRPPTEPPMGGGVIG